MTVMTPPACTLADSPSPPCSCRCWSPRRRRPSQPDRLPARSSTRRHPVARRRGDGDWPRRAPGTYHRRGRRLYGRRSGDGRLCRHGDAAGVRDGGDPGLPRGGRHGNGPITLQIARLLATVSVVAEEPRIFARNIVAEPMRLQQSNITSVTSVVDNLPGVSIQEGDAYGFDDWSSNVAVRGFQVTISEAQIGTTIDGFPNGTSDYFSGAKANRFIDPMNLGGVEVSQGTADIASRSVEALGGTFNYLTDDPAAERDLHRVEHHRRERWQAVRHAGRHRAAVRRRDPRVDLSGSPGGDRLGAGFGAERAGARRPSWSRRTGASTSPATSRTTAFTRTPTSGSTVRATSWPTRVGTAWSATGPASRT